MNGFENAILLALVAIIPLVVLTLTSFVKVSVVLSLLRNAIGAPDAPSGLVVTGLSLVLTFFVMAPVAMQMTQAASEQPANGPPRQPPAPTPAPAPKQSPTAPASATPASPHVGTPAPTDARANAPSTKNLDDFLRTLVPAQYQPQVAAAERALGPLRAFLAKHTRDADRDTFVALSTKLGNQTRGDELWVLAPAFITTELREAFAIAILVFVPFLVIDLIVGLGLASLGLQMTNPQTISLPLKLALFVAVDGWRLLLEALLRGYA
jgi:type III secretion protein R